MPGAGWRGYVTGKLFAPPPRPSLHASGAAKLASATTANPPSEVTAWLPSRLAPSQFHGYTLAIR